MAKKMVEKYALDKNEIAKYPTYKEGDTWLVPIFDKNTGKFKGSVFVDDKGSIFVNGPDSYSEYKDLIHGKKTKHTSKKSVDKSKSKKSNKQNHKDKPKKNKSNKSKNNTISNISKNSTKSPPNSNQSIASAEYETNSTVE